MRFIILLALCFASSAVFAQKARFGSLSQQSSYVVTNEVDALAMSELNGHIGPRIALLESGTNGWNAAYAWGNHALANYMAATSRTERVYAPGSFNEWRDGSGKVWRVTTSSNWVCNIPSAPPAFTVPGLSFPFVGVFTYSANDYTLTVTEGSDVYDFTLVSGLGDYYEVLDVDVTGSETASPPMTDIELLSTHELPNAHLVLTGQVVTQQVDTVALVSQLPGIVMSNAVSQMVVWTNAAGAVTNMARLEGGIWYTNAFGAGEPLPEGVITNNQEVNFSTGPIIVGPLNIATNNRVVIGGNVISADGGGIRCGNLLLSENGAIVNYGLGYIYNASGYTWNYYDGANDVSAFNYTVSGTNANANVPHGSLTVRDTVTASSFTATGTNTAAVVRSQSSYLMPHLGTNTTISLIFTNGTLQAWEIAQ